MTFAQIPERKILRQLRWRTWRIMKIVHACERCNYVTDRGYNMRRHAKKCAGAPGAAPGTPRAFGSEDLAVLDAWLAAGDVPSRPNYFLYDAVVKVHAHPANDTVDYDEKHPDMLLVRTENGRWLPMEAVRVAHRAVMRIVDHLERTVFLNNPAYLPGHPFFEHFKALENGISRKDPLVSFLKMK